MANTASAADTRPHHDLDVTLDPANGRLEIIDEIKASGHQRLAFKPAAGLLLAEIRIDDEAVSLTPEDGVYWIELPTSEGTNVTLSYGGELAADQQRGGLAPMLSAEGVFLPYGLGWLANAGAEDDWVTYDVTINTPTPFRAVATGALVEETEENGNHRSTFRAESKTEPPSIFAGNYQVDERDHNGTRLRTYFPIDQQQLASVYLDQAAGYIDLFEDRIGDYPYDGFSMIAAPLPVGMGFPGLTYVSARILRMPFMQTRSLAHEIAHNWWANGVFIDYSEGNWAEGLTTFMADYALAEAESPGKAEEMRLGWLRDFAALPAERDQPLTAFRGKGHDADQVVGYNKAAMVFHMLKQEIGEDSFDAGLRAFWAEHKFQTANWSNIKASFEAAAKRDLDEFFEPWLTRKGAPSIVLDATGIDESDGGFELSLSLSSPATEYALRVPVQIETAIGVNEELVFLKDGNAEATFTLEAKPLSVGIDQHHDLFRHLAADEAPAILRDVTLDQTALTVLATADDGDVNGIAHQLAARTLDTGVRVAELADDSINASPLMLIGLDKDVASVLSEIGIAPLANGLKDRGTARSWVATRDEAPPVLVVEARDAEALGALLRPLPHYSRNSFIVFDGSKAIDKGVWPTGNNALKVRFDGDGS
ncbi:MAG: M1 family metallopeptidase [Geminicoccaceae bacterium]